MFDTGGYGSALPIVFWTIIAVILVTLLVRYIKRRRDPYAGNGRWAEGPYAPKDPPPISAQRSPQK